MLLNPHTLHLPKSISEAARLYEELENVKVLAGGTFLLNSLKLLKTKGTKTPAHILSLTKVKELSGITLTKQSLLIRAMTTITELKEYPGLSGALAVLPLVCQHISTNPIRNMATVGGNLTCRYTWTELGAVMIGLDATMHFLSKDGLALHMPAEDFFKNAARAKHLLTHVEVPVDPHARVAYRRVKKSLHVDVPLLTVCISTRLDAHKWANTRVAINNGVAFAQRDNQLESFLNGQPATATLGQEALAHLTGEIYDTRAREYKQHMFRVSIKNAINEIACGQGVL